MFNKQGSLNCNCIKLSEKQSTLSQSVAKANNQKCTDAFVYKTN